MIKTTHGIEPQSIEEFRKMVTGLRSYSEKNHISKSQWAKYDVTNWGLFAQFMPGKDRTDLAVTCVDVSKTLEKYHIIVPSQALHRIVQHMINRKEAIKPCKRNIGHACMEVIKSMGEVRFITLPPDENGFVFRAYYFGIPHAEVIDKRRAFELIIKP